jgi:hypothetical protein
MIKKTWLILGEITQDDLMWIHRAKFDFTPGYTNYIDVIEYTSNRPMKIAGKAYPGVLVTTNDKEETWLNLYFADRLILQSEEIEHKYY